MSLGFTKLSRQTMIDFCKQEVARGSIYVRGASGERGDRITATWIRDKEPKKSTADAAIALWNENRKKYNKFTIGAFDSGSLVSFCINSNGNPGFSLSADSHLHKCKRFQKDELQPGDFVFDWNKKMKKVFHMGVYIGNGRVIEARGREYGVVETALDERDWVKFGRPLSYYTDGEYYEPSENSEPLSSADRRLPDGIICCTLRVMIRAALRVKASPDGTITCSYPRDSLVIYRGVSGDFYYVSEDVDSSCGYIAMNQLKAKYPPASDEVKAIQRKLGIPADGIYDMNTADAVTAFQKAEGITVDGIYGPETKAAMLK